MGMFQASAELSVALNVPILWLVLYVSSQNVYFGFYTKINDINRKTLKSENTGLTAINTTPQYWTTCFARQYPIPLV